jgi:hypothetical protein
VFTSDRPCWLYQAVSACTTLCIQQVHTSQQTAALSTSAQHYGTSAYLFQCVSSVVHIQQLGCVDMVHKPCACSSDHNHQTTSRQLQTTEQFKLSRLVVGFACVFSCQVGKQQSQGVPGCVYVLHKPVHAAATRTAGKLQLHIRAAQHASNHLCMPLLVNRVVKRNLHAGSIWLCVTRLCVHVAQTLYTQQQN